jgi:copper chaperone NosL
MRPLEEAAQLERSMSIAAITVISLVVLAAILIHTKWAALLVLPALLTPYVFLADMYYWMRNFGTNLDPTAPLSSSIEPFVPPILGEGFVGQFRTVAEFEIGLYMAFLSGFLIIAGLYFHRRAYKPLVEQMEAQEA